MTSFLGSVGWGLLAFGALAHVWHHQRLRALLAMHLDRERLPAAVLTAVEVFLSVAIPTALLTGQAALRWLSAAAGVLAIGFVVWITRLLVTGSDLPCACSFSEAPTSRWSLARSICVALVVAFAAFAGESTASTSELVATLAVGWAVAAAIFVLPEAVTWPDASKALMTRVDAHTTASPTTSTTSS